MKLTLYEIIYLETVTKGSKNKMVPKDYKSGYPRGLRNGASMDYKIEVSLWITCRGKKITKWGIDFKSGQELQIGASQLSRVGF